MTCQNLLEAICTHDSKTVQSILNQNNDGSMYTCTDINDNNVLHVLFRNHQHGDILRIVLKTFELLTQTQWDSLLSTLNADGYSPLGELLFWGSPSEAVTNLISASQNVQEVLKSIITHVNQNNFNRNFFHLLLYFEDVRVREEVKNVFINEAKTGIIPASTVAAIKNASSQQDKFGDSFQMHNLDFADQLSGTAASNAQGTATTTAPVAPPASDTTTAAQGSHVPAPPPASAPDLGAVVTALPLPLHSASPPPAVAAEKCNPKSPTKEACVRKDVNVSDACKFYSSFNADRQVLAQWHIISLELQKNNDAKITPQLNFFSLITQFQAILLKFQKEHPNESLSFSPDGIMTGFSDEVKCAYVPKKFCAKTENQLLIKSPAVSLAKAGFIIQDGMKKITMTCMQFSKSIESYRTNIEKTKEAAATELSYTITGTNFSSDPDELAQLMGVADPNCHPFTFDWQGAR